MGEREPELRKEVIRNRRGKNRKKAADLASTMFVCADIGRRIALDYVRKEQAQS